MIKISDGVTLPNDAVTQTFAFLARRGAGKSYGSMKLAEGMLDADAQIVALDPVGVWYGLRIAEDGKGKGFDIPIFGGMHGDIPLEPGAGALIADLVVDRGISVVLDVSLFRKGERKQFATAFAEQLFHRKKQRRSPLHVFIEEAQVFVPQRAMGDEARMLGAEVAEEVEFDAERAPREAVGRRANFADYHNPPDKCRSLLCRCSGYQPKDD